MTHSPQLAFLSGDPWRRTLFYSAAWSRSTAPLRTDDHGDASLGTTFDVGELDSVVAIASVDPAGAIRAHAGEPTTAACRWV